jgi:hypothetical protein
MIVGHQPDIQNRAHKGGIERGLHAFHQGQHHGRDSLDVGRVLRVDTRERNDEADDCYDETKNNQAVGEVADDANPVRQLEAQVGCQKCAAVGRMAAQLGEIGAVRDVFSGLRSRIRLRSRLVCHTFCVQSASPAKKTTNMVADRWVWSDTSTISTRP